jgi:type IV pilus assembly protein PilB
MKHWLLTLAERAGLPNTSAMTLAPDTSSEEAWMRVMEACGVTEQELSRQVALAGRCDLADFNTAEARAIKLLPEDVVRRHHVFPVREDYRRLVVAVSNPSDINAEQDISFASGRTPVMEIASPSSIAEMIRRHYSSDHGVQSILQGVSLPEHDRVRFVQNPGSQSPPDDEPEDGPIVRLGNLILQDAINQRASDVHIQCTASGGAVRFRVDGMLRHYMQLPVPVMTRVVSRIKVLGGMDIADRFRPQDGRRTMTVGDRPYDLRLSTVPTRGLETAVIRILGTADTDTLASIGLPAAELNSFRNLLQTREGIVVVTGPTGSGKTTTIYAALKELATEQVNIMTVEDPVEYELPGLTQIQVEPRQGVTFTSALRAVLRQDPDVIFIGEIRDRETAEVAVQASRTGHLVLTTLHTNDAIGILRRLADLGLDSVAIVDTLRGALAQRLIRRVCPSCAKPVEGDLPAEELELARRTGVDPPVRTVGCDECGQSGFRGRLPVVEMFTMNRAISDLIRRGAGSGHLYEVAVESGMTPLREAALNRVREGSTTLEEAARVVDLVADPGRAASQEPQEKDGAGIRANEQEDESLTVSVLVVDDDGSTRMVARVLLESIGYRVTEAEDGLVAVGKLKERAYDLVILDLDMPRMDGRELLARVRQGLNTIGLPVIVLTGSGGESAEVEMMGLGADDYIRKPIDPPRFISRVQAVLRRAGTLTAVA